MSVGDANVLSMYLVIFDFDVLQLRGPANVVNKRNDHVRERGERKKGKTKKEESHVSAL